MNFSFSQFGFEKNKIKITITAHVTPVIMFKNFTLLIHLSVYFLTQFSLYSSSNLSSSSAAGISVDSELQDSDGKIYKRRRASASRSPLEPKTHDSSSSSSGVFVTPNPDASFSFDSSEIDFEALLNSGIEDSDISAAAEEPGWIGSSEYKEFISIEDDPSSQTPTVPVYDNDRPFRADVNGKSVVVGIEVSHEEFFSNFIVTCDTSRVFGSAANMKRDRIFVGKNLQIIVDQEFDRDVPIPSKYPLHPIFFVARELLIRFIHSNDCAAIKDLIDAGLDTSFDIYNSETFLRFNCLHYAMRFVRNISVQTVELLLASGINPNAFDSDGYLPMHYLSFSNNIGFIHTFIKHGANFNLASNRPDWMASIHYYAVKKNFLMLKALVYMTNVDINQVDFKGRQLIHLAIYLKNVDLFDDILARPNIGIDFICVMKVFALIEEFVAENKMKKQFLFRFVKHLIKRNVHSSHLHYIIFTLIKQQNMAALEMFHTKKLKFDFTHHSQFGRNAICPLSYAIEKDSLEVFKFFQRIGLRVDSVFDEHVVIYAIKNSAFEILTYYFDSEPRTGKADVYYFPCLELILESDSVRMMEIFIARFQIANSFFKAKATLLTAPNIYNHLNK